jgi:hypothetical protein
MASSGGELPDPHAKTGLRRLIGRSHRRAVALVFQVQVATSKPLEGQRTGLGRK